MSKKMSQKISKVPARVTRVRVADEANAVVSVEGGKTLYRREPCDQCPWRKDAVGVFPAEVFRISAPTAYDLAQETFGCHSSGTERPAVCAGFLLRGAEHNMKVRMAQITGAIKNDVTDGRCDLHDSYRAMAVANGVDPNDPALAGCRDD
jgi:hypothetical protein